MMNDLEKKKKGNLSEPIGKYTKLRCAHWEI